MGKRAAIIISIIIVFIGYMCYERFPDGVSEPWKLRAQRLSFITLILGCRVASMFGGGDTLVLMRYSFQKILPSALPFEDPVLEIYDTTFDNVTVRVYRPKKANKQLPGLIYYHGGGWFFLSVDTYDEFTRRLAKDGNMVVVSVEYRLAPEHKYPIPFDDCVTATKYFLKNADKFGVDRTRIGLAGDSTGGSLAAGIALKFRDDDTLTPIRTQVLIYPFLQACTDNLPIHTILNGLIPMDKLMPSFVANYLCTTAEECEAFDTERYITPQLKDLCSKYVSETLIPRYMIPKEYRAVSSCKISNSVGARAVSKKLSDPYTFPLMAQTLVGLPPTYVFTAEMDELRDDGIIFSKRLERDGVKVEWTHFNNATHGAMAFADMQVYEDSVCNLLRYLRRTL